MPRPKEELNPAHQPPESRLKDGCVLLSHENLEDPNFRMTVILVCVVNKDGAFGLICNRPSHMPLSEVFTVDAVYISSNRTIYIGGPVDQDSLHVIQIAETGIKQSYRVAPEVFLGGNWESIESILTEESQTTRLFLGYSGWGAGQLEKEIQDGVWEVFNVDVKRFLLEWEEPAFNDYDGIRTYLSTIKSDD